MAGQLIPWSWIATVNRGKRNAVGAYIWSFFQQYCIDLGSANIRMGSSKNGIILTQAAHGITFTDEFGGHRFSSWECSAGDVQSDTKDIATYTSDRTVVFMIMGV